MTRITCENVGLKLIPFVPHKRGSDVINQYHNWLVHWFCSTHCNVIQWICLAQCPWYFWFLILTTIITSLDSKSCSATTMSSITCSCPLVSQPLRASTSIYGYCDMESMMCALWHITIVNSFCCRNGTHLLQCLHPLPPHIGHLLNHHAHHCHLVEFNRVINNLFSFTGIGVSGGFQHFLTGIGSGPPVVAITSCTYHLIWDTEYTKHSIHWLLYDKHQWEFKAQ